MLPLGLLALGAVAWVFVTVRVIAGQPLVFKFLYVALSLRILANFFHHYTAPPLLGQQSINSVLGVAIIGFGLFLSRNYLLRYKVFLPVYALIGVMVFSALYNGGSAGLINAVLRQLLFVVIAISVFRALDQSAHDERMPGRMLSLLIVPLLFQAMSVVFRVVNLSGAQEGSLSFIGGYVHEGVFSTVILIGLVITVLSTGLTWKRSTLIIGVLLAALIYANYRTTFLAAIPLLVGHVFIGSGQGFRSDMAAVIRTLAIIVALIIAGLLFNALSGRLSDVALVAQDFSDLFKPPREYDSEARDLLSGRLVIWSNYVFTTVTSSLSHILIGFGPDAWEQQMTIYAHNVYVSYLYEMGVIGVAALLLVMLSFLWLAMTARHPRRWALVASHLGYLILCLGTMPTVTIEGVFLYAIICGYTLYYRLASARPTPFVLAESARALAARHALAAGRFAR